MKKIGQFEVKSGKIKVSDPCYDKADGFLGATIPNAKKGTWNAFVVNVDKGSWGNRVGHLIACQGDNQIDKNDSRWEKNPGEIAVDSGQAGIYDEKWFKDDSVVVGLKRLSEEIICEDKPWYSFNCDRTIGRHGGVIPYGAVSSSGFGDGGYDCYTITIKGKVVAVMIDYGLDDDCNEDKRGM